MKLWSIKDDGNENFFWELKDSFDISSLKKITLRCNNIEWIETYSYEDENGQSVQISKNHYFDNGTIAIPIESDFKISLFDRGSHQFSIYDLDGNVIGKQTLRPKGGKGTKVQDTIKFSKHIQQCLQRESK